MIPVSVLYGIIILIRNKLYDSGIFKIHKAGVPVVSIGNISTGGSGKTPLTIFIAKYFLEHDLKVAVISRGYKRSSTKFISYTGDSDNLPDIETFGDELVMMYNNLALDYRGRFIIAASADRAAAAEELIKHNDPDVILLDDAFQHRRIYRDLDIVLIDSLDMLEKRLDYMFTIPSGRLRETMSSLRRADFLIQNDKSGTSKIISFIKNAGKDFSVMRYKTECIMDSKNDILKTLTDVIVFSGIADDKSFCRMISAEGYKISDRIKYPDHHRYTERDITFLKEKYKQGSAFVTTEKDFVKIRQFSDFIDKYPVYFLKLKIEFTEGSENLFDKLNKLIT